MTTCPDNQNISEFNYEKLREVNLNQIKNYYDETLNKYITKYEEYKSLSESSDPDENDEANFIEERGEITELNNHLIDIKKKLNNLVNKDLDNILIQKNKIQTEKDKIKENQKNINNLNLVLKKNNNDETYYNDSLKENEYNNNDNYIYQIIYIVANVCVLVVVLYLLYSVFSKKAVFSKKVQNLTNNNNNNNNNSKINTSKIDNNRINNSRINNSRMNNNKMNNNKMNNNKMNNNRMNNNTKMLK